MKKVIRLLCIIMTIGLMVSGCSKDGGKPEGPAEVTDTAKVTETPEVTEAPTVTDAPAVTDEPKVTDEPVVTDAPVVTDEPAVTDAPVVTDEPVVTDIPEPAVTAEDALKAYDEYIAGSLDAVLKTSAVGLETGEDYSLNSLAFNVSKYLENDMLPSTLTKAEKAIIDCGKDGYPELALKLVFENDYDSPYTDFFVIRFTDGNLEIVSQFCEYYREYAGMNEFGYITIGGSGGAFTYSNSNKFINADGEEVFLWYESGTFGYDKPCFGTDYSRFSEDVINIIGREVGYAEGGNGYELDMIAFMQYDPGPDDDIETYTEEYYRNCYYTFVDFDGNNAVTDEEYINLCNENGVQLKSLEEIDQMRAERAIELGCTAEIVSGEQPAWEEIE